MNQLRNVILVSALSVTAALTSTALLAQAPDAPADGEVASTDNNATLATALAEAEARLAAIEQDSGIDEAGKNALRPKYQQAIDSLKQATEFADREAIYREAIKSGPEQSARLREQLESLSPPPEVGATIEGDSSEELQKQIAPGRAEVSGLNEQLEAIKSELASLKGRPVEISERLPQVEREISDIQKRPAPENPAGESTSPAQLAELTALEAEKLRLLSESKMLKQEQSSLAIRESVLQARRALLSQQLEYTVVALDALEGMSRDRLKSEAEEVGALAKTTPEGLLANDEAARALADEVQALAGDLASVAENLNSVKGVTDNVIERNQRLTEESKNIRESLRWGVGGGVSAQVLFDLVRRVHSGRKEFLAVKYPSLDNSLLLSLSVSEKRRQHPEVESRFSDHPEPAVAELVTARSEVLEKLKSQYANLTRDLANLEGRKEQYLDDCEEVIDFAREQLFWMRSSPPISSKSVVDIPASLEWALATEHSQDLWGALRWQITGMPMRTLAILLVVTLLLLLRPRISAALRQTGVGVRRISTDRHGHTVEGLMWTVLLATPIPLLFGFFGWSLPQCPNASEWLVDFSEGIWIASWAAMAAGFLAAVCRPGGLGVTHFGWSSETLHRLRRAILSFTVVYIPAMLLTISYFLYGRGAEYSDSVGRFLFMLCHIWVAIVLWNLLIRRDGILTTYALAHPNGRIARWRYFWSALALACPLALVALAVRGYLITASELSLGLYWTATLIALAMVSYQLTVRWFRVRHRKLALAQAIERHRAHRAATNAPEEAIGEIISVDPEVEDALDLEAVGEQTRVLLRLVFMLIVGAAVIYLWSATIPFVAVFESIPVPLTGGRSLLVLMQAILILVVTYVAAQNLPGLLELAGLRAATSEPGKRYAVTTICKYAVIAAGLTLLCNVWQVDWAKLSWIAAALSVGLGFGLQEVVANFVCGLILLFEQPIRVGDVVTLENTTGTVTKIRMRSTTITNWDRQDFVVPNKNLITGTILNWTLSASVNRLVIPIGVAYGSDTEKARQILLDVAAEHPRVLKDPAPLATFEEFADSSLNLVLRAYLPDLDNRLGAITELHTAIDKQFAAAGIEIAFPQRDLNLRSGWSGIAAAELCDTTSDSQREEPALRRAQ